MKEKYYNVTLHVSLPAESVENAETLAVALVDTKGGDVNVDVLPGDTVLCSGEDEDDD